MCFISGEKSRRAAPSRSWRSATRYSSWWSAAAPSASPFASRVGGGTFGLPVVDMIEVSERTRCGNEIAISWAIMPPMDGPTRWAELMPRTTISPVVSSAMSINL